MELKILLPFFVKLTLFQKLSRWREKLKYIIKSINNEEHTFFDYFCTHFYFLS